MGFRTGRKKRLTSFQPGPSVWTTSFCIKAQMNCPLSIEVEKGASLACRGYSEGFLWGLGDLGEAVVPGSDWEGARLGLTAGRLRHWGGWMVTSILCHFMMPSVIKEPHILLPQVPLNIQSSMQSSSDGWVNWNIRFNYLKQIIELKSELLDPLFIFFPPSLTGRRVFNTFLNVIVLITYL